MTNIKEWETVVDKYIKDHIKEQIEGFDSQDTKAIEKVTDFTIYITGLLAGFGLTKNILQGIAPKELSDIFLEIIHKNTYLFFDIYERIKEKEITYEQGWNELIEYAKSL